MVLCHLCATSRRGVFWTSWKQVMYGRCWKGAKQGSMWVEGASFTSLRLRAGHQLGLWQPWPQDKESGPVTCVAAFRFATDAICPGPQGLPCAESRSRETLQKREWEQAFPDGGDTTPSTREGRSLHVTSFVLNVRLYWNIIHIPNNASI